MAIIPSSFNRFKIHSVLIKWEISKSWGMGQLTKYSLYKHEDPSFYFQNHKSKQTTGHSNTLSSWLMGGGRQWPSSSNGQPIWPKQWQTGLLKDPISVNTGSTEGNSTTDFCVLHMHTQMSRTAHTLQTHIDTHRKGIRQF